MTTQNPNIPRLRAHAGSYAVIKRSSGQVVCELFRDSSLLPKLNFIKYMLVPIDQHLASLSRGGN